VNKNKTTPYIGFVCVLYFALGPLTDSLATGFIKVESNGFLRTSDDRADSSSTVSVGPDIAPQGKVIEGKLDLKAIVQVSDTKKLTVDKNAFTMEAANAYFATSKKLMPHHQVTIGRRVYDWSRFDDAWQFGTHSPRFIWDPTRPETVGLTGLFYTYESRHWRAIAYSSPVNIPERGYPLRNENGKLTSTNPFAPVYPESAVIAKRNLPVQYTVDYPPMSELVLNPGGMTSLRYSTEEGGNGVWVQGIYGVLPVHQANLAIEAYLPAQVDAITVKVHPEIQNHHLLTFETGFQRKNYGIWGSVTKETPSGRTIPNNWIGMSSQPAMIYSAGGSTMMGRRWKINATYLFVDERVSPEVENQDFSVDLGGRFPYHRAAQAGLDFYGSERMTYTLGYVADFEKDSQFARFDITYRILRQDTALTLNLGSDFFASTTGKGYIGQFQGNDRFRGGLSYAF
jgi:hypothetical protein